MHCRLSSHAKSVWVNYRLNRTLMAVTDHSRLLSNPVTGRY